MPPVGGFKFLPLPIKTILNAKTTPGVTHQFFETTLFCLRAVQLSQATLGLSTNVANLSSELTSADHDEFVPPMWGKRRSDVGDIVWEQDNSNGQK